MHETASCGNEVGWETVSQWDIILIPEGNNTLHTVYCHVLNQRGVEGAYLEMSGECSSCIALFLFYPVALLLRMISLFSDLVCRSAALLIHVKHVCAECKTWDHFHFQVSRSTFSIDINAKVHHWSAVGRGTDAALANVQPIVLCVSMALC